MKEYPLRRLMALCIMLITLAGCGRLESIPFSPGQTAETWLQIQPFTEFQVGSTTILIVQPTTSAIVYLLGVVTIGTGLYFLYKRNGHASRLWWGIALLLWGFGALLAGTSYEAFSYQIKCAGRDACIWTSWWEIYYLILSAASIAAMMVAQAYACAQGKRRRIMITYALLNISLYTAVVLVGALIPVPFLLSFELLLIVAAPSIVFFIILNGYRYKRFKQSMDLALLGAWAWLSLTIGAYFLYYLSGLTQQLWAQGLWFSENDVLHIGLILWMVYLALVVAPRVTDVPPLEPLAGSRDRAESIQA